MLNRIDVSKHDDQALRALNAPTSQTPNLQCRPGFCLPLEDPEIPNPDLDADAQGREFNRYTLTGQWDLLFFSLLQERLLRDGVEPEAELESQFKAHLSRGVLLLSRRLKSLADVSRLVDD